MSTSPALSAERPSASSSITKRNATLAAGSELSGRFLLGLLFLLSGLGKLGAYGATAAYMSAYGVPGGLLPAVIAIEVLGALAVIFGWQTRAAALLLAAFSLLTAITFHSNFADQIQMIMFFKNLAIAGGLLLLAVNGAGPLSLDARAARNRPTL